MNYQRIYDTIIERAKPRGFDKKAFEGYFEKHHIVLMDVIEDLLHSMKK